MELEEEDSSMNSWLNEPKAPVIETLQRLLAQNHMVQFTRMLFTLHAADRAAFFLTLDERNRQTVLGFLRPYEFAELFQAFDLEDRKLVVTSLDNNYVADMLQTMVTREAAAFLKSISERKAASLLQHVEPEARSGIELCMKYPGHTVGAILSTSFRTASVTDTVEVVLSRLRVGKGEKGYHGLYVTDQNRHLLGVVPLHHLLQAPVDSTIGSLMSTTFISIHAQADQAAAVERIKQYNLQALPVTDKKGILIGIITIDDVLALLEERITQRIQHFAALKNGLFLSSHTLRSVTQRLPWLIGLTLLGFMLAEVTAPFLASLQKITMLAIFIPVILGMSGNSGIQSLSVVIQQMTRSPLSKRARWQLLGKEAGVGLFTGIVCGLVASLLALGLFGSSFQLGMVIGIALAVAILCGTMTGAALPLMVERWRVDPTIASGPVVTTLNDIVALFVYYGVAAFLIPLVSA